VSAFDGAKCRICGVVLALQHDEIARLMAWPEPYFPKLGEPVLRDEFCGKCQNDLGMR